MGSIKADFSDITIYLQGQELRSHKEVNKKTIKLCFQKENGEEKKLIPKRHEEKKSELYFSCYMKIYCKGSFQLGLQMLTLLTYDALLIEFRKHINFPFTFTRPQ